MSIGTRLRPREGTKEVQALGHATRPFRLHGVVVAVGVGCGVGRTSPKLAEGDVVLRILARWQERGNVVQPRESLDVTTQGGDVANFERVIRRDFVLNGRVVTLEVGGLVSEFDTPQLQVSSEERSRG